MQNQDENHFSNFNGSDLPLTIIEFETGGGWVANFFFVFLKAKTFLPFLY